jgi:hypothetical protein
MDDMLKMYYTHSSDASVARQMGMSLDTIKSRAKRLKLKKSEHYQQLLSKERVLRLQKSNCKYTCNHAYFSQIDAREKAYWLGWLWSDGCVLQRGNSYQIRLALQKGDENILQCFRIAVGAEYSIRSERDAVVLTLFSQQMFHDLGKYGVIPHKSLLATYPNIERGFISDFVRGVFDGDGHISRNKSPQITIIGTEVFCSWLQLVSQEARGARGTSALKKNTTFRWTLSGKSNIVAFAQWMYHPLSNGKQVMCLERKYQRFIDAGLL